MIITQTIIMRLPIATMIKIIATMIKIIVTMVMADEGSYCTGRQGAARPA